ncbi:Sensor protein FixL [Pirellulimonas nuda]|uniref:histidine kinase n=1 Tax=Pirellulimonas nuda TaxID=2528009 RepID=A0A518D9I9_9BACT|nr:PAS domain-containing protein [Pirellulimonas nuda]QDU88103.1 Sensor protein FixL [Pirellulimonas nuda]
MMQIAPGSFDSIDVAVLLHDVRTAEIVFGNRGAARLLGAGSPEQLRARMPSRLCDSKASPRGGEPPIEARILAAAKTGECHFRASLTRCDGQTSDVDVTVSLTRVDGHEILLAIWGDATQGNASVEGLRRANEELRTRAIERSAELRFHHRFEDLLIALATRFINLPGDQIEVGLQHALQEIGVFTGVDRCFLYTFDDTVNEAGLTHEWVADGVPSIKATMQHLPLTDHSWGIETLRRGQIISVPDTAQMPDEAKALREMYWRIGVKSATYVPLIYGAELRGMLGFSTLTAAREWTANEVALLRVLAEVLASAIERQRVETALRVSEYRYRSIVNDQTDLVVRWLPDRSQTFVNEAACRYFDASAQQLLSETLLERVLPEDREAVDRKLSALTADRPVSFDERRVVRPNGETAWMQWVDRALVDGSGRVCEYQSVGRDITKQKHARENLRKRLEFERMLGSMSARFLEASGSDLDATVSDAIGQVAGFLGAEGAFIQRFSDDGATVSQTHVWRRGASPEDTARLLLNVPTEDQNWLLDQLRSGRIVQSPDLRELPPAADGVRRLYEWFGVRSFLHIPLFAAGRVCGSLCVANTQTSTLWPDESIDLLRVAGAVIVGVLERADADRAIQQSEERLRITIDAVEEGLYDWNIAKGEVYLSDHWLRSLGHSERGNVWGSHSWRALVHPEDAPRFNAELDRHLSGASEMLEVRYRLRGASGEYVWFDSTGRIVEWDDQGQPQRMVGLDRDISQEIVEERRRSELEGRVARLSRAATMGVTVAGITHEVNQPLHAAATFTETLKRTLESDRPDSRTRAMDLADKVAEQVDRAGDILRKMRSLTRPTASTLEPTDLNAAVREAGEQLAFVASDKGIATDFRLDVSEPQLRIDRVQLQQVVINLIQNAYDATANQHDRERRVIVSTDLRDGFATVAVQDNGPGPEEPLEIGKLFDPFFTTKASGMGIGLSLCKAIADRHGWTIAAELNPAHGMTFSLLIPENRRGPE